MKKNGFTVVELIVSFTLTMVVAVVLFQIVTVLTELYASSGIKTEMLNKQAVMTNLIYDDFENKKIYSITNCGIYCVNFEFMDATEKTLSLDTVNNLFNYGSYVTELVGGSSFGIPTANMETILNVTANRSESNIIFHIPVVNILLPGKDYGINLIYQFDSRDTAISGFSWGNNTVILSGNITHINSTSVTLTLGSNEASTMCFSNVSDVPSNCTTWVPYETTYDWTLPSTDGTKTVYAFFKDSSDNIAPVVSDTIVLDTAAPTSNSVVINDGAAGTNITSVLLTLASTGANTMCFSNTSNVASNCTNWVPYATNSNWTLTSGEATKTVYAFYKDVAGNISASVNDTIILDTTAPTSNSIVINAGAASTSTVDVTLTLASTGAAMMCFSNTSSVASNCSSWVSYAVSYSWSLTATPETKTVYAFYKDTAGNISTAVNDTILLESLSPRTELILNGSDPSYETGLIPIVYDEVVASPTYRKWVKADIYSTTNTWYEYATRKWANAVMVTSATRATYEAAAAGTEILEADILGYLVWVPRYEYKFTGMAVANAIVINFISSTTTTPSDAANYKVHPAFTFGAEELSGIWIGKFETTGTAANPTVKPNISSLRSQDVSTQFLTAQIFNTYGLAASNDAHMMKNSEWGAAAYLSHSIYGSCSNATTCTEKYINNSSGYYTGRSGGSTNTSSNVNGTYSYEGRTCSTASCNTEAFADITLGTRASTTGNIYGIYDMSGGSFEKVLGVYSNAANNNGYPGYSGYNTTTNSGYNGWLGYSGTLKTNGVDWGATKYYGLFTSLTAETACSGGVCYGQALSETASWYSDTAVMVSANNPWIFRGGAYNLLSAAGIFARGANGGNSTTASFRLVVSS